MVHVPLQALRAYLWRLSVWHRLLSFDAGHPYNVVLLAVFNADRETARM